MKLRSAISFALVASVLVGCAAAQRPPARPEEPSYPTGSVRVCVSDSSGAPLEFASVGAIRSGESRITDNSGCALLSRVPAGRAIIRAMLSTYLDQDDTVLVAVGDTLSLRMRMRINPDWRKLFEDRAPNR